MANRSGGAEGLLALAIATPHHLRASEVLLRETSILVVRLDMPISKLLPLFRQRDLVEFVV